MSKEAISVAVSVWGRCLTRFDGYPGWRLPSSLENQRLSLVPLEDKLAQSYIALEHSGKNLRRYGKRLKRGTRILIALEPAAVAPGQHSERVLDAYGLTLVQSPLQIRNQFSVAVTMGYIPPPDKLYELRSKASSVLVQDPDAIGIINENKFSFVPENHYRTRRRLVREIATSGRQVNLAGKHWDASMRWLLDRQARALLHCILSMTLPDLRHFSIRGFKSVPNVKLFGRVESEIEFLAAHTFSLVVENDPKYISEKLFNAIIAGTVPIYIGPDLATFKLPRTIAFSVDANISGKLLNQKITSLTEPELASIRKAGKEWLDSKKTQNFWSHERSFDTIARVIREHLEGQLISDYSETNC